MQRFRKLLLFLIPATCAFAWAQDEDVSPFLRAVGLLPTPAVVEEPFVLFTYADIHAALASRGIDVPTDWSGVEALEHPNTVVFSLPQGMPGDLAPYLVIGAPGYRDRMGFDFFQVGQTLEFAGPPYTVYVLQGSFDPEQVVEAFVARDYEIVADEPATFLCPVAGCDTGMSTNLINRDLSVPFGGHLGRRQPVAVTGDLVISSTSDLVVEALLATRAGEFPSFADVPEVRALDALLAGFPYVTTVTMVNPAATALLDPMAIIGFGPDADPSRLEAVHAELDSLPLPFYNLTAFASVADEQNEYGLALLIYPDAELAAIAAASVDQRLQSFEYGSAGLSFADYYGERGAIEPATVFTHEESGISIVVLSIVREIPPLLDDDGVTVQTGQGFSRLFGSVTMRDAFWLVPSGE